MLQRIQRIADHLKKVTGFTPETGIILGTGLSGLGKEIAGDLWEGKHTLRAGESIYGIARHYKTTAAELQRVNDITDPARVRIGTVLKVPAAQPGAVLLHDADPAPAARTEIRARRGHRSDRR